MTVVGAGALAAVVAGCSSTATLVDHPAGSTSPAHVGDTLTLKTQAGRSFDITLTQVSDPAHSTGSSPSSSKRYVAVLFKVTNTSSQAISGDANADADVVGNNDQTYSPAHVTLSECGSSSARFQPAAGASSTSCVAFLIKKSVSVSQVQFSPAAGAASVYGQWQVP